MIFWHRNKFSNDLSRIYKQNWKKAIHFVQQISTKLMGKWTIILIPN